MLIYLGESELILSVNSKSIFSTALVSLVKTLEQGESEKTSLKLLKKHECDTDNILQHYQIRRIIG